MAVDPTGGWAKAVESASNAGAELVKASRETGHFLAPALKHLVGMAEDQFAVWRVQRQVRLADRLKALLGQRGLDTATRTIAPAFLVPLIERASIEENDSLQDVWAMMLANAVDAHSAIEMRSAFVTMLGEMTHLDVVILAKLSAASMASEFLGILPTALLPKEVGNDGTRRLPSGDVAISLANLGRLACILPGGGLGGWLHYGRVTITELGKAFVAACTPPLDTAGP